MNINDYVEFIRKKHGEQKRIQGTLYYLHPVAVSKILESKGFSKDYQIAGLMHDLLEDTDTTYDELLGISNIEIAEAVRRGHTTVDGVKFYTRAGMGRCQGGFCSAKIFQIISKESGIPMENLTKRGGESRILAGKLGDLEVK